MTRSIRLLAGALALAGALPAASADAQTTYPQTIYWGSGLVDIPVAWVPPITGDFAISYAGKHFNPDPNAPKINYSESINSQLAFSLALAGRAEIGYAAYSGNPEWGFFGTAVLLRQEDVGPQVGWGSLLVPSVAVGVRNVGPYEHVGRFGIGYDMLPPQNGSPDMVHVADAAHREFNTANTVFGVLTKDFSLATIRPTWPDLNFGVTLGYGNGLFQDDGGLGDLYSTHDRGGLFWGVKGSFTPAPNVDLTLMFEDNSWDYNAGASLAWRGLRLGLHMTEIGAGSQKTVAPAGTTPTDSSRAGIAGFAYNYTKWAFTVGWESNVFALLKGNFLQGRYARLEQQRNSLLAQITQRQQRIAELELEINRFEAQSLLELEQRRLQAEAELREERARLQRLEEQLKRIEQQQNPPPPTIPPTTPPANPPVR